MVDGTPSLVAHTGTWTCPICLARIPVTLHGRPTSEGYDYSESPDPWWDVYWHIGQDHPEGMD